MGWVSVRLIYYSIYGQYLLVKYDIFLSLRPYIWIGVGRSIETMDLLYVFLRVNLLYDKIWNIGNYCVNILALLL
jgi:hypothetical protein